MILVLAAALASVVLCGLWIFIPQRKLPKEERIPAKKLILSIVMGLFVCTLCIIILDEIFDKVFKFDVAGLSSAGMVAVAAFIRAALIEEVIKFLFVKRAIKKIAPEDNVQFMLVAGTIGMGYNVMEKVATLEPFQEIMNALFPMHIFLQFVMAYFLFRAALAGNEDKKKKILFNIASFVVPFVIHGVWDSALLGAEYAAGGSAGFDIGSSDVNNDSVADTVYNFILVGVAVALIVLTAVWLKKMKVQRLNGSVTPEENDDAEEQKADTDA